MPDHPPEPADVAGRQIAGRRGRSLWRGLDEIADPPELRRRIEAEFPSLASRFDITRREILKLLGAPLALAGLGGCKAEADQRAVPYVEAPEFMIPGRPEYYATAVIMAGHAQPVLGKTHVGRPIKLEGNPDHPASLGATDPFTQAALLGLYDPDRSQAPRHLDRPVAWSDFDAAMVALAAQLHAREGEGFRLLTGATTSPTLARQIAEMNRRLPQARWHSFNPAGEELRLEAARLVFGRPLERHLALDAAEMTVAFDDDILGPGPRQTHHARMWSARRLAFQNGEGACLLHVAEGAPSITGVRAAERLIASPLRTGPLVQALAAAFGLGPPPAALSECEQAWTERTAERLAHHRGRSIVTVGAQYAPEIQALALRINDRLGNLGRTIRFTEPLQPISPDGRRSLEALAEDMQAGRVTTLAMIGVNPVYTAPADLGFADLMSRVELAVHAGLHRDETAALSHWHLPLQHDLESWSDARAVSGHVTVLQPLVRPFYNVRSPHVVLETILGNLGASDHGLVRETWRAAWGGSFEERWTRTLLRGFIEESTPPEVMPNITNADITIPPEPEAEGLVLVFQPDSSIWDGTFGNNAWLQELPDPLTKMTWGNVVAISPALASELGIASGDEVRLTLDGREVRGPAWVMPGQEERTVTVTLGYGREAVGQALEGLGYDAYRIRLSDRPWLATGVSIEPTGKHEPLATTQLHFAMEDFDFVRTVPPADLEASAPPLHEPEAEPAPSARAPSFYPDHDYDSPSWGMSIDLDTCIGCNACVVACIAENNIPMVGKKEVANGREMHWLRVDRYHEGDPADPRMHFQPVPCMHCEKAPCEMGCPVNATVHTPDGLNAQVYNRCIGTRTCSSFCPYKVRRFNWFDFTGDDPPELQAMRNPDVTVRDRGVMEKCTYCVQRISAARITAKIEGRPIRDGEVQTACQQACPTEAIIFGDVIDPDTKVSRRKASSRDYSLLEEANTWPRTTYLARIDETRGDPEGE